MEQQSLFEAGEYATPLTPQQLRCAEMLAFGSTRALIQSRQGVSLRELAKWERTPEFQAAIKRLQAESREYCIAELKSLGGTAVGVIRKILEDDSDEEGKGVPPATKINAAFRLLDLIGVGPENFATPPDQEPKPVRQTLDAATIKKISEQVYGIAAD